MNTKHLIVCLAASGLLLSACSDESATETMSSTTSVASSSAAASTTTPPVAAPTSTSAVEAPQPSTLEPSALASAPALPSAPPAAVEANTPIDARSPDEIVAGAGERGQRYLAALRLAGIPPSGMDSAEILYADGTCNAIAQGMPRSEVLAEFKAVGDVYAQITPMTSPRIAEIYVETAENTYC
ncbi:DUF732 domain-containing protein [Rhodococcus sp. NPDC056743]|uniref:DUF732 domain-containing protein n=1 Tax=Rhodococcus sp. NPDC056743 TaxID=3345934 RepID=UPI00366B22D3